MTQLKRNLDGPYQRGVANPYTVHVHPYPTRFHGAIYTRPVFKPKYIQSPHSVFKPDDFYDYYGVSGLGNVGGTFGGSSMGNGVIGGNSLGLGATGAPIYYLASRANTKVSTLQAGINKVMNAQRFPTIPVTGKFDDATIAALTICLVNFNSDLRVQVGNDEIISEATRTGEIALKNAAVKKRVIAITNSLKANRSKVPAEPYESSTSVTPADGTLPNDPSPTKVFVQNAPPVAEPIPVEIQEPTQLPASAIPPPASHVIELPEVSISARPATKTAGKASMGLLAVLAVGAGYYAWKKFK